MGSMALWEKEMALGRKGAALFYVLSTSPHFNLQPFPSNH